MGNRLSKIATRTGDNGTTGLGDGSRVSKDSLRVHAMGNVDELNSHIGLLLCEELPAALREIAEKTLTQAKTGYDKIRAAAEDTTGMMETTYANASKGSADYGLAMLEQARANTNSAFDYFAKLMTVKSVAEAVEVTTAHARQQFETSTEQVKELTALAQKLAQDTAEPLKSGLTSAFNKAA